MNGEPVAPDQKIPEVAREAGSYTLLRAHENTEQLLCRTLLDKT